MPARKTWVEDPNDSGKLDVYRDLEERVLRDLPAGAPAAANSHDKPGQSIIRSALAARDTRLLRSIAAEREGLTDRQRRALLLLADLLDHAAARPGGQA